MAMTTNTPHPSEMHEIAAMDFEPWPADTQLLDDPKEWMEQARAYVGFVQLCERLCLKSKGELMKHLKDMPEDEGDRFFEMFDVAIEFFEKNREVVASAQARILIAGAASALKEEASS